MCGNAGVDNDGKYFCDQCNISTISENCPECGLDLVLNEDEAERTMEILKNTGIMEDAGIKEV